MLRTFKILEEQCFRIHSIVLQGQIPKKLMLMVKSCWIPLEVLYVSREKNVQAENAAEPLGGFWTRLFGRRVAPRLRTVVPKEPEELSWGKAGDLPYSDWVALTWFNML